MERAEGGSETNVASLVLQSLAARGADAPKVVLDCGGLALSSSEVLQEVFARGAALARIGLGGGDVALIASGRGNSYWIDLLAVWTLGAVGCPVEREIDAARLSTICSRAGPRWLLGSLDNVEVLDGSVRFVPDAKDHTIASVIEPMPIVPTAGSEPALILFTSGTTGAPKGAVLSHEALISNARGTKAQIGLTTQDLLLFVIPFRFVSAVSHVLVGLISGVGVKGQEQRLLQADFCRLVSESGCTAYGGSPIQARWIMEAAEQPSLRQTFPQLRWIMSSGDNLPEEILRRVLAAIPGLTVVVAYGLTELAGRLCIRIARIDSAGEPNTVGRPIEQVGLRVVDPSGLDCGPGMIGVIMAQGPCLFGGYVGDTERTAEVLSADGFATGDLACLTELGNVQMSGRDDDVFKVGGKKVSCLPIASALLATGLFKDLAVIPRPYPIVGQAPHAVVVPKQEPFDKGEVLRILRRTLPADHLPRVFLQVPEIPRTGSGKVNRLALAAILDSSSKQ
jgi:acyl-coenzyme A synthetase/AMP-(fatty) acid ligase